MFCHINRFRKVSFATLAKAGAGLALLSLAACSSQREIGVQLILNTDELEPTTTFELRFEQPVAAPEEVSQPASDSPLVIAPSLPGRFVWLSQRSGLYTPSEPTALGQAYHFSLRPGLRSYGGQASSGGSHLNARLDRTLRTPPLSISDDGAWGLGTSNAPSEPEIVIQFNAEVRAADAKPFCDFRNSRGVRVPAEVWQATRHEYLWSHIPGSGVSALTWKQQFDEANGGAARHALSRNGSEETEDAPIPNRIIVTPAKPLPVGDRWRLIISKDIPSRETSSRLATPFEMVVGDVTPFVLAEVLAHNYLRDGKWLSLNFSKEISPDIGATNWADWISLSPRPANLSASVQGYGVRFNGDFLLDTRYTIGVRAGFPAAESFVLGADTNRVVEFAPLPPRLYFPAFSTTQLEKGGRHFELLALNLPQVRLRAKQLDRHTLIHALRGYESYSRSEFGERNYLEPYHEVDFNVVPGKTIFDQIIRGGEADDTPGQSGDPEQPADDARKVRLDWDKILGPDQPGAVFLTAERPTGETPRPKLGSQALVQLTDLGMVWKSSREEAVVYLFSHATGKPVPNATVYLMSEDNEPLAESKTDAQGLARLPRTQGVRRSGKSGRIVGTARASRGRWLMAEFGPDLHAVPMEGQALPLYGFNVPVDWWSEENEQRRVMLFSDRPVYRPGEMVHLKGLLRGWEKGHLVIPAGVTGRVDCLDAKGQKFFETNVLFSALGSWAESVLLPQGCLGQYRVELRLGEHQYGHWFQVQEFQPNAFEVSLKAKKSFAAGEKAEAGLSARYYMGKNLSRAKVRWSAETSDSGFAPDGFDGFVFGTAIQSGLGRDSSSYALQGEGMLSNKTELILAPEITFNPKAPQPRSTSLFVEVTDLNQQTIAQTANFTCFSSDFFLGLKRFKDVVRAGEPLPVEVIAVRPDGSPCETAAQQDGTLAAPVRAHVTFQHVEWRTVRVEGAGRTRRYRSEPVITNILEQDVPTQPVRRIDEQWESQPRANQALRLVPPEAGLYLIEVRTKDEGGRDVVTAVSVNVTGKDDLAWNYRNEAQMDLLPDQTNYLAGETATLLVKAPFSGTALVTVERETVLRSFVAELTGNAPAIRVPLETNDTPNVFVSVLLVRGSGDSPKKFKSPEYRLGYCQLNVTAPESKLGVAIRCDAADYRPGEEVKLAATVRDFTGQPVPDAEVTLYAVDEGILSLTGYPTPDPHSFFYHTRPLSVQSCVSLPNLLPEDPEQLAFHNKGYLIGGGGRGGRTRKNFLPCAFWNATLRTGSNGLVEASFVAPDSLTRYRVVGVAHSTRSQFGSGQTSFQINKPLMIEPALPRFANVTDRILARAVVHNQTEQPGEVEVTLQLDDKAQAQTNLSRILTLSAHSSTPIEFPLEFTNAGRALWIWKARFLETQHETRNTAPLPITHHASRITFTDSVQSTLNVGHVTPLLREIHLARSEASETNLLAGVNPQLLEGKGTVTVSVSNSRLNHLGEAISELLHYPYGCVEQTTSSLLPWLVLRDMRTVTPQLNQAPAQIQAAIDGGLRRLLSMQTQSGGLSYWPGEAHPMLWGSAYGGMALALAARQKASLPEASLDRLFRYLGQQLRDTAALRSGYDLSERCLALYTLALAGRSEAAYQEVLFAKRDLLSAESRALLALAILESKGPGAMAKELLHSRNSQRAQEDDYFGCGARESAVRLLAWLQHQPGDSTVDVLVEELMKGQREAHWGTTQGNAWALLALTEYARRIERQFKPASGAITFGEHSTPFQLESGAVTFESSFPLSGRESAPLMLANPSHHLVFTKVKLETRPQAIQQPPVDRGYLVRRTYSKLDDDGASKPLGQLRVGDSVVVTLQIEVREAGHYVAVDDALPSLFEAINPELKSQQASASKAGFQPARSENWFSDFRELRTDRALFFRNHLGPGSYTIQYLARVRAAGTATAPAAKVEEMYHPERFGLSDTIQINSLPLE